MRKALTQLPTLIKLSYQEWSDDHASRLAASLAYYTIFSLAPLLILIIAVTGLIWQQDVVRTQLLHQIQGLVGAQGAGFVSSMINSRDTPGQGTIATIIGIVTLILGALGVFTALQNSLNAIWDVQDMKSKGFFQSLKRVVLERLLSFTMILGIGFLLLVSLVISTGLSAVQRTIGNMLPLSSWILQVVNLLISLGVITVLFAFLFKYLPDAEIAWRDVWLGAFATSVLFSIGKTIIGFYLGNTSVASSYGTAGSLVVLLLWIYYSAQILFFGAELTQVYANNYGSRIIPDAAQAGAQPATKTGSGAAPAATASNREVPAMPAVVAVDAATRQHRLEKENRQTARALAGMILASFFTGLFTTIVALRKR